MAKCYVCGGKGSFLHLGREICKKCFLRNMEQRVKKHLGRNLFRKNDKILVAGPVEKELLQRAIGGRPVELKFTKKMPKAALGFDLIIYGKTMDELENDFLEKLFKGKLASEKEKKKFFNLLGPLTEKEVQKYAELKGIKRKGKKCFWEELKGLEETKYNLYKNMKELKEKF